MLFVCRGLYNETPHSRATTCSSLVLSCVAVAVVAVVVVVFPSIIYCKSPAALSPQRGKLLVAAACEILIVLHRGAVHQWRGSTQPF